MNNLIDLKVIHFRDDVVFVEKGYEKEFLYLHKCDEINTIILFSVLRFNRFNIPFDCDIHFWRIWIDWFSESTNIKKQITFTGKQNSISRCKYTGKSLLYSGGKDSRFAEIQLADAISDGKIKKVTYIAQAYRPSFYDSSEFSRVVIKWPPHVYFSCNLDNIIWHQFPELRKYLKLEVLFPIMSVDSNVLINIEKEIWDAPEAMLFFNIRNYYDILAEFGLNVKSPIKDFDSYEILKYLKSGNFEFEKCNANYNEGKEFCYDCEKCFTYLLLGCDLETCGFDRKKYLEKHIPHALGYDDIAERIKSYCFSNSYHPCREIYFMNLMKIGKERMNDRLF